MEVMTEEKKGFKRTEVGLIPEDWDLIQLSNYTSKIGSGITPRGGKKVYQNYGRPFVRSQNIGWGFLRLEDLAFIDDETHATFNSSEIEENDVLLNITGASIGRSSLASNEIVEGNVNQHVCIIRTVKGLIEPKFLNLILLSEIGQKQIDSYQAGGNREGLNFGQIGSFLIPLPPTLSEQEEIASALSDVDELIRSLDGLIQKKQAIKKGAMQQLLSGKKRLPGFDGVWVVKKLGELGNTLNGLSGKTKADFGDGNHPYITFMNVMSNTVIDTSTFDTVKVRRGESQSEVNKGDLLFNTSSETPEEVGMCSVLLEDIDNLHLNSFCFGYRIHEQDEVLPLFLAYYFRSEFGRKHMQALAQGSTRYNLSKSKFVKIEFELPEFEEQRAIVQILSDMDRELQTLHQKREKYVQIKQGMMQELLTGRVRLV